MLICKSSNHSFKMHEIWTRKTNFFTVHTKATSNLGRNKKYIEYALTLTAGLSFSYNPAENVFFWLSYIPVNNPTRDLYRFKYWFTLKNKTLYTQLSENNPANICLGKDDLKMCWRRLKDIFSVRIFSHKDLLKMSLQRRLHDVLKKSTKTTKLLRLIMTNRQPSCGLIRFWCPALLFTPKTSYTFARIPYFL